MSSSYDKTRVAIEPSTRIPATTAEQLRRAVRSVAHFARDADDLATMLDMLGLDPRDGKQAPR